MGMRDALLVLGGLLIVSVLAHGAWIAWRARRADLRVRYERNIPNLDLDDIDLLRAELPSGGARVVTRSTERQRADDDDAGAGAAVPVPLDPIDPERDGTAPAETPRSAVTAREGRDTTEAGSTAISKPVAEPAPEPDAVVMTASEAVQEAPQEGGEEALKASLRSEPEQAPLFAGDPIVARDRGARRRPAAETRKAARERKAVAADESEGRSEELEIEEVLVINVLRRDGALMPGSDLLEVVSEHGLRYGDMNIFHRYGAGQRIDYSMANAVKPGTFDLGAIDELRTPGVTFFMRLPGPDQPLEAFDDLAHVAGDMSKRLSAELKDERHSVMTAQTLEHCRQRIREFRRRQMSRRS